jgi:MarR family transcriptional regulator for hemolysin
MKSMQTPIGLLLAQTAKAVSRAFDDALGEAGGSTPMWLILTALVRGGHKTQADLAAIVGVQGPTLTHHLNGMESDGLLTRTRLPDNRRVHAVALTEKGKAAFHDLRQAAMAYDARLRREFSVEEIETFRHLLDRIARVASAERSGHGD